MTISDDDYWKQGSERLSELVKRVDAMVNTFPLTRRKLVQKMLSDSVGEQFMMAPASTRRAYHNAFPCGLVMHSLNVADRALSLAWTLAPGRWDDHKVAFAGLFHDLGKAGTAGKPYYLYAEEWMRKKNELYQVSKDEYMPASEKSLFILQQYGITLDHEESAAIRLADGQGSRGNADWSFNEPDLALIIHWADHWEMRAEKAAAK